MKIKKAASLGEEIVVNEVSGVTPTVEKTKGGDGK
jgi:hypothetical protein